MKPSRPRIRTLDVRPFFARGEEPFTAIMEAVAGLAPAESLVLITPFLPSPLIEKLESEGFAAFPQRLGDGSWQTQFRRKP